ncbi:hypothetical protein BT96DRAFT_78822 [Gymnopus androsaceus JB14]|uniref:Uncharacterized protein n=1 Tax=Gymnopus androsaceus JB14 TaxID=1447944 RepID=A0A6A4HJG7_9AGAR|nr:hypothetical protein BT96DRAFT_78822 [Gymnopus androsaceus JB14]
MLPPGDGEDIFIWFYNPKFDAFHRKKEAGSLGEYWMLHHITNLKTSIAGLLEQLNYPAMPATEGGKSFFCALLVPKIVRDESGAFKMTPGCKKAWEHTKLEKAKECEGICIIDQTQSELFEDSYQDCQRKKMDPLLSLSDATREKLETFRLTPYAKIAYRMELEHEYTQQSLLRNGIYYWEDAGLDTLPDFVVAKINQIESRRDWLDWNPNVWLTCKQCITY